MVKNFDERIYNLVNFMAFDKSQIEDKFIEKISGAAFEYGKCILSLKNGYKVDSYHWCGEYTRLLGREMFSIYQYKKKGSYSIDNCRINAKNYLISKRMTSIIRGVTNTIKRENNVTKLKYSLTIDDYDHFWKLVDMKGIGVSKKSECEFLGLEYKD